LTGRVIRSTGKWYKVKTDDGQVVEARLKGKIRLQDLNTTNPVAVGDIVFLEKEGEDVMISGLKDRQNFIIRQSPSRRMFRHILAANIDQAFLLVTMSRPRTSSGFIDRFLISAEAYHIPTIIVFNKQDALTDKDKIKQNEMALIYQNAGYEVVFVSSLLNQGIERVKEKMKNKTTLLCGHSGVGKSTFANAIDESLNLKTKEVSSKYEKGVHTTTFAELFELPFGGSVIDIPGIKEFGVIDFKKEEVGHYFREMLPFLQDCRFSNCLHLNEPGCAVKKAVEEGVVSDERYTNYLNILSDIDEINPY
jgi:ribosome biogenesis GTPase / thiamine phosphate phosphatase